MKYITVTSPYESSVLQEGATMQIAKTSKSQSKQKSSSIAPKPSKDMEMVFQESHELFAKLISVIPDAVILTNMQGKIIFVNDVGIKLLRSTSEKKIIGKDALSFISLQHHKKAEKNLARLLKNLPRLLMGDANPNEYTVIAEDGSRIPVEIHGSIFRNSDGSPFARVHVCRDITERKRAENALRESEEKYRLSFGKHRILSMQLTRNYSRIRVAEC